MNTIITKGTQEYRMSIIYDKTTHCYILVFSSVKNNHGEQYTCSSYSDAVTRFEQNRRFYGDRTPIHIPTEEEFLGVEPGQLWPKESKRCRA